MTALTTANMLARYGTPQKEAGMALWLCPADLLVLNPALPKRVYANRDIHAPLTKALRECQHRGVLKEITKFDGCFNIRNIRGSGAMSTHSWGLSIDWNAKHNPLGLTRAQCLARGLTPFTETFVQCWESTGWHWGGRWHRADGQHFQLARLP